MAPSGVESLNPEIERLFFAVADLDPAARQRYLDEQRVDPETRAAVERLVEFDRGAATYLGTPVASVAARIEQSVPAAATDKVGPYRLIREIGRGGMGAVYEAERSDGEVRLRVAVKFVSRAIRSDFVVERFKRERQILANLNHSNICRLIDAGTAEDGSPYLVMELIEGRTIDEWCRGRSPREICQLFGHVCDAVQHAHQNLVVHRDLKPGNILVTASGEPKLLDFGIAKLLDAAPANLQNTLRALTPDYASPEQVAGLPITAATDIYGLGCVLYHLLTGKPPRRIPGSAVIPNASTIQPSIPRDLDAILARALQPEPSLRYATAREFGDDLAHWAANEPVRAMDGSFAYSASLFIRRHSLAALALALTTLLLAGGIGYAGWRAYRAEQRLDSLSLAVDRTNLALSSPRQSLADALKLQLAARPDTPLAAVLVARTLRAQGDYGEAAKILPDASALKGDAALLVLALRSQLALDEGQLREAERWAAQAAAQVSEGGPAAAAAVAIQSATVDHRLGRLPVARQALEQALERLRSAPPSPEHNQQIAATSSLLARILQDAGDLTQAHRLHEETLRLEPHDPVYLDRFGQLLEASGERNRAQQQYAQADQRPATGVLISPEERGERIAQQLRHHLSLRWAGQNEQASRLLESDYLAARAFQAERPQDRYAILALTRAHAALSQFEAADRSYQQLLAASPTEAELLREFALNRVNWASQLPKSIEPCNQQTERLSGSAHPAVSALAKQLEIICRSR